VEAKQKMKYIETVLGLLLMAGLSQAFAQPPKGKGKTDTKGPVVSSEVLTDRSVTFRIAAPRASEVSLYGDWMTTSEPVKLRKTEAGVWSATVGPLLPDLYTYFLVVDGVKTADPANAMVKQNWAGPNSLFYLPGKETAFQDNREVPHGEVRKVWYESNTLGVQRRMHIYTPPGYEDGDNRYPVLYLLHGRDDDDSDWTAIGRAGFILDNLLADKRAVPMLIVMPNGGPSSTAVKSSGKDLFISELLKNVIPYVEEHYRVLAGQDHRALAGLSMGGGQTVRIFVAHPDTFAYVGVWGAGIGDQGVQDATLFAKAQGINKKVKLFSIRVGKKDNALAGAKRLSEMLTKHGIKNELQLSGGAHTWNNWRRYLHEFAPLLFRDK
jgi:enterochelin esterase-like enzyme